HQLATSIHRGLLDHAEARLSPLPKQPTADVEVGQARLAHNIGAVGQERGADGGSEQDQDKEPVEPVHVPKSSGIVEPDCAVLASPPRWLPIAAVGKCCGPQFARHAPMPRRQWLPRRTSTASPVTLGSPPWSPSDRWHPSLHLNLNACFLEGARWANPSATARASSRAVHACKCRPNSGTAGSVRAQPRGTRNAAGAESAKTGPYANTGGAPGPGAGRGADRLAAAAKACRRAAADARLGGKRRSLPDG